MPDLNDAAGRAWLRVCRWAGNAGNRTLLFPEGALRLPQTARAIHELCDGKRTFGHIVQELRSTYIASDPVRIRQDAIAFLERLRNKRLVDF
ncbi:MAG: pyrroloquinoline quinone biosynthesis peptide chaperone PqqD [Acidobacteria bacterium]|nr:MAG: pyrroloquinoline quinone biosynthesis peptide chaperone PqqD [Acidobacteriota bacterium]